MTTDRGEACAAIARAVADSLDLGEVIGRVAATIPPEGVNLEAIERDLIQKAMAQAQNNKSVAAKLLGLPRGQLYSRLKRHGLDRGKG